MTIWLYETGAYPMIQIVLDIIEPECAFVVWHSLTSRFTGDSIYPL